MATIYSHHADLTDYSLTLESMTRNGYFPLTVLDDGQYSTTLYDDISEVTRQVSTLLATRTDMGRDDIIKAMEEIRAFFTGDSLEVWVDDDDALPYLLNWDDADDED